MVREGILNIITDGNMIINRIGKMKKAMITTKKKRNPNKITYQQTQIIKIFTSWVIGQSNMWKEGN